MVIIIARLFIIAIGNLYFSHNLLLFIISHIDRHINSSYFHCFSRITKGAFTFVNSPSHAGLLLTFAKKFYLPMNTVLHIGFKHSVPGENYV